MHGAKGEGIRVFRRPSELRAQPSAAVIAYRRGAGGLRVGRAACILADGCAISATVGG
jgi:hypothetical protein